MVRDINFVLRVGVWISYFICIKLLDIMQMLAETSVLCLCTFVVHFSHCIPIYIYIHVTDLIFILFLIVCTRYTHVSLLCKWYELINLYVVIVVVVVWLYIYLYWCELWPMTSSRYFIVIHGSVSMSDIANNNNISIDADQFKHIDIKVIIVPFSKTL